MLPVFRAIAWLVLVGALATPVAAQTVPFAALPDHITLGDTVSLTGADGGRATGKVIEITASSLTLLVDDSDKKTFPDARVRRVVVRDSVRNGALIGLITGAIPGAGLGVLGTTYCDCPAAPYYFAALAGAAGAGLGAGIDGLIHRSITVGGAARSGVSVVPLIGAGRRGMRASIRF